jgi:hypothetical protein
MEALLFRPPSMPPVRQRKEAARARRSCALASSLGRHELMTATGTGHLRRCELRSTRSRRRPAFRPPRRPQLDSQIGHRHPLGLGQLEPPVLLLGIEWGNLCMVTPSEIVPTSVRFNPSRHIGHVAQALHVIAGNPRSLLVLLTPAGIAVTDPVSEPPLTAASHPTQALTGFHPGSNVDVRARGPGDERSDTRLPGFGT